MIKHEFCFNCGQIMKIYRRNIRKNMVYCLRRLAYNLKNEPTHSFDIDDRALIISDFTKLKYWGLIRKTEENKYIVTMSGLNFLEGKTRIPKYKWVYDGKVQPDQDENPLIYVWDITKEDIMNKEKALTESINLSDGKK